MTNNGSVAALVFDEVAPFDHADASGREKPGRDVIHIGGIPFRRSETLGTAHWPEKTRAGRAQRDGLGEARQVHTWQCLHAFEGPLVERRHVRGLPDQFPQSPPPPRTRARPGMHEAAAAACGASLTGALEIWEGRAVQAFCPAPAGLHHAMVNRASGMCIYNDAAVAIRALLDRGAERVAYIDVNAHHGNGVQWISTRIHGCSRARCTRTGATSTRAPAAWPSAARATARARR